MTLGLHDLLCTTGVRLLRSLKSCGQVSFNRSTTYARSTSYDVMILVLHASNTFALPPPHKFSS